MHSLLHSLLHSTDSRLLRQAANAKEKPISFTDDDKTLTIRLRKLVKTVDDLEHSALQDRHRISALEETVNNLLAKQAETKRKAQELTNPPKRARIKNHKDKSTTSASKVFTSSALLSHTHTHTQEHKAHSSLTLLCYSPPGGSRVRRQRVHHGGLEGPKR